MARRKEMTKEEFLRRVKFGVIGFLVLAFLLYSGLILKASNFLVDKTMTSTDAKPSNLVVMKHPDSGPRVIVRTTGERIECQKVMDYGTGNWSYVRKDGAISSVRKEDVKEIIPPMEWEANASSGKASR